MAKCSIALILIVLAHQSVGQTPAEPSSDLYSKYVDILGGLAIGTDQFDEIKTFLRDDGFRPVNDSMWRYSDSEGIVAIATYPSIFSYNVTLTSKKPTQFGDAALAALINSAQSVFVEPGDSDTAIAQYSHSDEGEPAC